LLASLCSGLVPSTSATWIPVCFLIAGGLLLIAEIALSWSSVSLAIFQRSTFYSLNALFQVGVVVLILVLGNYFTWRRSERASWMPKLDWTRQGLHTFSPQTEEVLQRLSHRKQPIRVLAFFLDPKGNSRQERQLRSQRLEVISLLERYARKSERFAYELIDPEVDPVRALEYKIKVHGTVIFEAEERRIEVSASELFVGNPQFGQKVKFKGEQIFTSKLLDILDGTKRTLYFLTGHDEGDVDKGDPAGLSKLRQGLEAANIRIKKVNLLVKDDVPDDCSVLVLVGPRKDLTEHEVKGIQRYVEQKRPALFLVDSGPYLKNLANFLAQYGVRIVPNIVIEPAPSKHLSGRPTVPIPDLNGHAITNPLIESGMRVVFNQALGLTSNDLSQSRYDIRTILQTSAEAWGETDLSLHKGEPKRNPEDLEAPVSLAFAISSTLGSNDGLEKRPKDELRLSVHGDADYVNNTNLPFAGNFDFFMNTVAWLTRDMDRITIRPKEFTEDRADIPQEAETRLFLGLTFGLPSIFLALGFSIWWTRRSM
jgi:membrane protein implicated in regulation of membrane protease activity